MGQEDSHEDQRKTPTHAPGEKQTRVEAYAGCQTIAKQLSRKNKQTKNNWES